MPSVDGQGAAGQNMVGTYILLTTAAEVAEARPCTYRCNRQHQWTTRGMTSRRAREGWRDAGVGGEQVEDRDSIKE